MARAILAATVLLMLVIPGCGDDATVVEQPAETTNAPAWVHVSATASDAITLRWEDTSTNEIGFLIQRSTRADGGFADLDTVSTNVKTFTDASVTAATRYYYRVLSYDALDRRSRASEIAWGEAVDNTTPVTPATPYPPDETLDLDVAGLLTLSWSGTDPDGDQVFFDVYFGQASNALSRVRDASLDATHMLSDTLTLTRFYFWRIAASDQYGATALSPLWSFGTKMERLEVPAGYFFMGDCGRFYGGQTDRHCMSGEHPVNGANPVYVERFLIDKFEVSNQLFAQFLNTLIEHKMIRVVEGRVLSVVHDTLFAEVYPDGDGDSGIEFFAEAEEDSGLFVPRAGKENHPAVEVSWYGARRFARYFKLQLPTEAQWEKAARCTLNEFGDTVITVEGEPITVGFGYPYPWGADSESRRYNYWGSGDPFESRVAVATSPIGFYDGHSHGGYATRSNGSPYGVFDMSGNVAEWCADDFHPYSGGTYGGMKVVKGGGWRSGTAQCQTFWRQEAIPDSTDNMIGFRTVMVE